MQSVAEIRTSDMQGFTLIELLLAVLIFSLVTVGAFAAINSLVNVRDAQLQVADRLSELQLANYYLERDIAQLIERDARGEGVNREPAVAGQATQFRGTRVGWDNPLGQLRSNLQRFQYRLARGQLLREHWVHVDHGGTLPDVSTVLVSGVSSFTVRYQDSVRQWQNRWPAGSNSQAPLPRAVEITLELDDGQRVRRIFTTVQAGQS